MAECDLHFAAKANFPILVKKIVAGWLSDCVVYSAIHAVQQEVHILP